MKQVRLYNSMTSQIEILHPQKKDEISMYVCGPTVYNFPHVGNMRPVVVFDVLRLLLEHLGYRVTYVSNYTDVDDKIIQESMREKRSEKEITDYYIKEYELTVEAIGSKLPTYTPRVTDYIESIISYIDNLVRNGHAYNVSGNVYFDINSIQDYGQLSHINREELLVGARIEENPDKKSPLDFVLWKKTEVGIRWASPWGKGRPGWHTECCVMIETIFNHQLIDIHGGGYDLKFPHHENEMAQSLASDGHILAQYWIHNSFVNVENEKMSKSVGNVLLARDLIDQYGGEVIRLVILSTHYRQSVNFSDEIIKNATNEITKLKTTLKQTRLKLMMNEVVNNHDETTHVDDFIDALCDDLNTANGLSVLYEVEKEININLRQKEVNLSLLQKQYNSMIKMLSILGLKIPLKPLNQASLENYYCYLKARENHNYDVSDKLREQLISEDVI